MCIRRSPINGDRTLPVIETRRRQAGTTSCSSADLACEAPHAPLQVRQVLGDEVQVHEAAVGVGQAVGDGARHAFADGYAVDL